MQTASCGRFGDGARGVFRRAGTGACSATLGTRDRRLDRHVCRLRTGCSDRLRRTRRRCSLASVCHARRCRVGRAATNDVHRCLGVCRSKDRGYRGAPYAVSNSSRRSFRPHCSMTCWIGSILCACTQPAIWNPRCSRRESDRAHLREGSKLCRIRASCGPGARQMGSTRASRCEAALSRKYCSWSHSTSPISSRSSTYAEAPHSQARRAARSYSTMFRRSIQPAPYMGMNQPPSMAKGRNAGAEAAIAEARAAGSGRPPRSVNMCPNPLTMLQLFGADLADASPLLGVADRRGIGRGRRARRRARPNRPAAADA